ncbi:MAG: Stalked cell differentiation-controlling protein [Candidatus Accumulibacter regalis]|uniref:diguanylate cyclase n=1 Tax=Accumulibacter regalis TaxID=522306 RepID=A0A011QJB2_ACCRE|nr:diguanylate cyclase [Accumulibacter sp.]EXI89115.1 MAG: Stalked cell differentiation-controlling protein [Candidatus Accumulibacter regalis]HRE71947.1 diguanylate cyclase [Accumulibacter sp.]HRE86197.1 diguanylate cyclase [Accumulibacter sp.]
METPKQRPRILIVDESRLVRTQFIQLIRDHYDFREEVDGEGGWQALVIDPSIQLVISALSMSMPVLDGDGLLARLRSSRLARLRQIPVLMIAGDDEAANARARALGASDFIVGSIGASELLARIDSVLRLAQAQNELRENPERDAQHPDTGLPTRQRVEVQAAQAMSYALRHESPVSILIMGFDRFDALRNEHGEDLVKELHKRFASMLATKVRKEDSLGHYSGSDLAVVSPGTPYPACEAFANRLREAFAVANIAVHGKRLNLSVSVGVANTPVDRLNSASSLLTLAAQRLKTAQEAGGNRVVACSDRSSSRQPAPRLGHAIDLIKAGHESAVIPHLLQLGNEVLPFLELLERELKLGLPLAELRKRTRDREH